MQFMDVVTSVLEELQSQGNPLIYKEEIEDLYCYKFRANNLMRQQQWARAIGDQVRRCRKHKKESRQNSKEAARETQQTAKRARVAARKEAGRAELKRERERAVTAA